MAFPGDPEVVKAQLINDVHVMNQQHLTRTFSQVRGCDKEDILRIVKNEWLTNFALRMIVDVMGHYNAYTDAPAVAWPTSRREMAEDVWSGAIRQLERSKGWTCNLKISLKRTILTNQ